MRTLSLLLLLVFLVWSPGTPVADLPLDDPGLMLKTLSDDPWAEGFHLPGFDGTIRAACPYLDGLFVGGTFRAFGAVEAENLIYFDGDRWWNVTERFGIELGPVRSLMVHDGLLVIGGNFVAAAPAGTCRNIAAFDGQALLPYGGGVSGEVTTLHIHDGQLVAGGNFLYAGDNVTELHNVARWTGSAWQPYGSGTDRYVRDLCTYQGDLVVAGAFSQADGVNVDGLARWTGTTFATFSSYGGTDYGEVHAVCALGPDLYAGGAFTSLENHPCDRLARWDGAHWREVGGGISSDLYDCRVDALHDLEGDLLVGGTFRQAGPLATTGAVLWNGSDFVEMAGGVDNGRGGGVLAAVPHEGAWWLGGYFTRAGGLAANRLVVWDGDAWSHVPDVEGAGLDGTVEALCLWNGDLVAGGRFGAAGTLWADHIARWDGAAWHDLGGGLDDRVTAVAVWNGDLVVGGRFLHAGGVAARRLARWDGAAWHEVGGGLDAAPEALFTWNGLLFAGGDLAEAGGLPVSHVASWDGAVWDDVGGGVGDIVRAFLDRGDMLLAGGDFLTAGGAPAARMATWDGQAWTAFGNGADGPVYAFAEYGGLVAGGEFMALGGTDCGRIGRWDGAAWHPLGLGFVPEECYPCGPDEYCCESYWVTDMAVSEGRLYVAGISRTGYVPLNYLACWTETEHWTALGSGLSQSEALCPAPGALWIGGAFSTLTGEHSARLARWDIDAIPVSGDERWWAGFDVQGLDSWVYSMTEFEGDLVAAGWFTDAGGVEVGRVAAWDGESWRALGTGFDVFAVTKPYIHDLVVWGERLYAAGLFTLPPAPEMVSFAVWNGVVWEPLMYALFPQQVYDLEPYGDALVLVGGFTEVDGVPASGLARYDGVTVAPLPAAVDGDFLRGAVTFEGNLVVYGQFESIDGLAGPNLARWDGSGWVSGVDGFSCPTRVEVAAVEEGSFYIGGALDRIDGAYVGGIARWSGAGWEDLAGGLARSSGYTPIVSVLTPLGDGSLAVAGTFDLAGGAPCSERIAIWDGAAWISLGAGFALEYSPSLKDMILHDGDLYVGGGFNTVADRNARNIARWALDPASGSSDPVPSAQAILHRPYPNPFNAGVVVRFALREPMEVTLTVHDIRGRPVRTLWNGPMTAGLHDRKWDGRDAGGREMASGVYLVRMAAGRETAARKLVYLR